MFFLNKHNKTKQHKEQKQPMKVFSKLSVLQIICSADARKLNLDMMLAEDARRPIEFEEHLSVDIPGCFDVYF